MGDINATLSVGSICRFNGCSDETISELNVGEIVVIKSLNIDGVAEVCRANASGEIHDSSAFLAFLEELAHHPQSNTSSESFCAGEAAGETAASADDVVLHTRSHQTKE